MFSTAVDHGRRPLGFFEACRLLVELVSTFVELNRTGFRALQRLANVPAQLMQFMLRTCAVAMQLTSVPLRIAQCSLQLLAMLQYCAPTHASRSTLAVDGRIYTNAGPVDIMVIFRSIVNALQIPFKLIVLPIAIFEAPFRLLSRQPPQSSGPETGLVINTYTRL